MDLVAQLIEAGECLVLARNPGAPQVLAELAEQLRPHYGFGMLAECREEARSRVLDDPLNIESNLLLSWFTAAIALRGEADKADHYATTMAMNSTVRSDEAGAVFDLRRWGQRLRAAVDEYDIGLKALARAAHTSWQTIRELYARIEEPTGRQRTIAERVLAAIDEDPVEWFEDESAPLSAAAEA